MTQDLQVQSEADRQIAALKTPQEAGGLRKKIKAIQALAPKRQESFETAFNGGRSYCEVSSKAGKLWADLDNKRGEGGDQYHSGNFQSGISTTDAGFGDAHDAMVRFTTAGCVQRDGQRRAYFLVCERGDDGMGKLLAGQIARVLARKTCR